MMKELNKNSLEKYAADGKMVLVEFSAPWCVYCRRLAPAMEKVAEEYKDILTVGTVNIDNESELARREKIEVVPTLVLYKNGQAVDSIAGPGSKAAVEAFIQKNSLIGGGRKAVDRRCQEHGKISREHNKEWRSGMRHLYDMIIIGGGPGGYTAALYAARAGLDTLVLEKLSAGGQMALTMQIDNYPGFDETIDGFTLGERMQREAERFGAKTEIAEVDGAHLQGPVKTVHTSEGIFEAKTVVLAMGAGPRKLGLKDEVKYEGQGLHYCAACDGMFYKGKTVVVVGGGNSAAADALLLSRICEKVIVVHRRDSLRATKVYHEPLMQAENIEFQWSQIISDVIDKNGRVQGIRLKDVKNGTEKEIACDGVFVSVGRKPASRMIESQVTLDDQGYIIADESTRTNLPGVFAVGDIRTKALRQIVTAAADGANAAYYAEEYMNRWEG